mmetsp:Transcript_23961/g.67211  ORF Transcript_23961/g.67211 Transcript_23961/m.67211 type:complete len:330 (+) Transcript_23961:626-1615(+)
MDPAPMRLSRTADRILRDEPLMQGATSKVRPERDMSLWKRASRFSLQLITTLRTFSTAAAVIAAGRPEAVVVLPGFKEGVEAEAPELPEASGFFWAAVASGTCICNVKDCGTSMYPRSSGSWLAGSRSRTLQSRQNKSNKTAVMTGVLRPPLIQHRATTASASACGSLRVALAASSRGVAMGLPSWPTAPTSSNCSAASDSASSASSASLRGSRPERQSTKRPPMTAVPANIAKTPAPLPESIKACTTMMAKTPAKLLKASITELTVASRAGWLTSAPSSVEQPQPGVHKPMMPTASTKTLLGSRKLKQRKQSSKEEARKKAASNNARR